jgi:hypothetical protein
MPVGVEPSEMKPSGVRRLVVPQEQKSSSVCPLTKSPAKRAAANQATAKIQAAFPPGVSQPALRALADAGLTSLDQLTAVRESDLLALHGMGPKALAILQSALKAEGKSFCKSAGS